ncbi:AMP-binding protein [Nakamurella sp. YIM 132087]|uniref:AMP-binding protein n=1 Tax=Nakamurella alba TaxID=2665158 RepID=A0A7K1FEG2_9ACTN|nr:AMP-binding protein [Nakamurella alba]MTD12466.1 AMP-binding protein [Nakamurella alba]
MGFATVSDRYSAEEIEGFYATGQWQPETLTDLVEQQVAVRPDRVFLTDDTTSLTFRELRDRGLGLAVGLHRLGIRAGDRVAVQMPNWSEFGVIAVALSRLGAIMVPIMPIYRSDDVSYVLRTAGVRAAIVPESFKKFDYLGMYTDLRAECPELTDILVLRGTPGRVAADGVHDFAGLVVDVPAADAAAEIGPGVGPDDPITIVFSSGTTSRPKGCLHTFNTLACGSRLLAQAFGYTPDDVQFGPSPVTHTTGLVTSIVLPMIHGAGSHIMEAWEPVAGIRQIRERGCTVTVNATTFLQMLLDAFDPAVDDLGRMRLWVAAGAPIPAAIIERAGSAVPGLQVLSLYGRTENVTTTTCTVRDEPVRSLTSDGRPLPLQSVKIVDEFGDEVPRGQEGDIAYKGAMHMLEYIGNAAETDALFTPDGHSRSGDLGTMDADGYVRVTGRTKDIVIRGGMNISVRQVEDMLSSHPDIARVAVVGMPDPRLGEKVCCYLVPAAGCTAPDLAGIREYLLGAGLAIQKVPERVEVVQELPTTATGKIQKHVLRSMIAETLSTQNA